MVTGRHPRRALALDLLYHNLQVPEPPVPTGSRLSVPCPARHRFDGGRLVAHGSPRELTGDEHEVRFSGRPRLGLASLRDALPEAVSATEELPGRYVLRGPLEPATLATVTAWCASHGVLASDLSVGRRTLEQVFLEVTGRGGRG